MGRFIQSNAKFVSKAMPISIKAKLFLILPGFCCLLRVFGAAFFLLFKIAKTFGEIQLLHPEKICSIPQGSNHQNSLVKGKLYFDGRGSVLKILMERIENFS